MHNPLVLLSLFITSTVNAITEAVASARAKPGAIAVLGHPRVGRALAERGHHILFIADTAKSLRRVAGDRLRSRLDTLPLADHQLTGLVAFGVGQRDDWESLLSEYRRTVTNDGVVVLVDRAPAAELTRRALSGGLADITQRQTGRTIITSGSVTVLQ